MLKNYYDMGKPVLFFLICMIGLKASAQSSLQSANDPSSGPGSTQKQRMNVIFFLVDDMGWSDVGYEGSSLYETPTIDSLAKAGVRFTQAYAACPVCSPTRGSIMTGEYPARTHLTDWLPGRKNFPFQKLKEVRSAQHLPYGQLTLPKVLQENGYATAIFGKWHLGEDSASTRRQGFDLHIPHYNKGWPNGTYFSPFGMEGLEGGPKGEYLTDRLTDEALKWIQQNRYQPFFLYLAHFAVHDPIQGRGDLVVKYERKLKQNPHKNEVPYILEENPDNADPLSRKQLTALLQDKNYQGFSYLPNRIVKIKQYQDNPQFAAMVESVDESLERVIAKLKELNLDKNTIIIFFSDNGGMSAANFGHPKRDISKYRLDKAYSTSNLPLRGGKGWLYEGGIRVPMIVYWPNEGLHGMVCNVPVISTDFYSTILDMLGISPTVNDKNGIDGMSLVPLLKGQEEDAEKIKDRALYWHWPNYSNHGEQSPGGAVRYGDYKLIEYFENYNVQLFNLKNDLGEQHDLSKQMPDKVKQLKDMLHAWRKNVGAEMPVSNPNYNPKLEWPSPSTL